MGSESDELARRHYFRETSFLCCQKCGGAFTGAQSQRMRSCSPRAGGSVNAERESTLQFRQALTAHRVLIRLVNLYFSTETRLNYPSKTRRKRRSSNAQEQPCPSLSSTAPPRLTSTHSPLPFKEHLTHLTLVTSIVDAIAFMVCLNRI